MFRNLILTFILWQISVYAFAQVAIIPNVPDYSQPPDTTLPSTQNDRSNYCAPYAYLNIVDYWENVYVHPNAQGMMGGLPEDQTVEYIGWFLDTNDQGDTIRMNGNYPVLYPSAPGTYVIDESEGMHNYVRFDLSNPLGFLYQIPPLKIAHSWEISPPLPEDFPGYMGEIDMGHLVKLDFLYWNPIPTGDSILVTGEDPETVHIYAWGPQVQNTGSIEGSPWEEWNMEPDPPVSNIGHAVTGVGYILDTLEFAIVHDNWSSTAKNIAIPWRDIILGTPYVTAMVLVNLPPAIVEVSLPDTTALSGDQLLIPIQVEDLTGLHVRSYFTNITFNQNILQARGATVVNTLSASWGAPNVDLSTPDEIIIGNSGYPELSGSGNLVYLQFDVVGSIGDTSQLQIRTMSFNFGDPAADTLSGSLIVVPNIVNVTITTNPAGLQIDVDGTSYATPKLFSWSENDTHQINAPSPQSGGTGIRYNFDFWNNNGNQQQTITVPANDSTFTASYYTEYELTTSVNPTGGGTINISPAGNWFKKDSLVILHAIPDTNFTFFDWSGDLSSSKNPDTLKMDSLKNVIANFSFNTYISDDFQKQIPKKFALYQNFPNPFNPSTRIKFDLPKPGEIKIDVYNTLGKKIKTLLDQYIQAGYHEIEFNGQNLSSGIYFYRIEAGEFQDVKKMVLLR